MKAWVTVSYFDETGDGRVLELDPADGTVREVLHFQPPASLTVPAKGLTGAALVDGDGQQQLLVCGSAAVFRFDARNLALTGTLALPSFNDLHGVHVHGDRMYVVNTGLDCVDVFTTDGSFLGSHSFEAAWLHHRRIEGEVPDRADWARVHQGGWSDQDHGFDPQRGGGAYYREERATPFNRRQQRDFVHPNHVVVHNGHVLVTSLVRKSVIDVGDWRDAFKFRSPPHDGTVRDGRFYVTRVDGFVEAQALDAPGASPLVFDATSAGGVSGWCRGLLLTDEAMWVGFTEIRERPGHAWDRGPLRDTTTAVVVFDRASGHVRHVFDLRHPTRHSKVFCILEAP